MKGPTGAVKKLSGVYYLWVIDRYSPRQILIMRMATAAAFVLAIASTTVLGQVQLAPHAQTQSSPAPSSNTPKVVSDRLPLQVAPDFIIGPGDILQISVWQEPQFGETVEVRPDGKISLPLVSDVAVAGLTPSGAQGKMADKLQSFVKHPLVTVVVAQVHSRMVYVIGEIEHPGPYPMVSPINVEQLIARAGGPTKRAKQKRVYILHQGVSKKIPVNYKKVMQGKAPRQNVELMPGDTVVVP